MGRTIIKPSRDEDFYVEWSSIVDSVMSYGTREEFLNYLGEDGEERLARTDRTGTSALWPSRGPFAYSFDDTGGLIYEQRGILKRSDLKTLCARLESEADISDLLTPFDEEEND